MKPGDPSIIIRTVDSNAMSSQTSRNLRNQGSEFTLGEGFEGINESGDFKIDDTLARDNIYFPAEGLFQ